MSRCIKSTCFPIQYIPFIVLRELQVHEPHFNWSIMSTSRCLVLCSAAEAAPVRFPAGLFQCKKQPQKVPCGSHLDFESRTVDNGY